MSDVVDLAEGVRIRAEARDAGRRVVFTNGCFDLLHRGHVEYLAAARALGDLLIVGLNSDRSVRALKGEERPFVHQDDRAAVLAALASVDYVIIFDDETPADLISALVPDVLAKGGDWAIDQIVGRDVVEAAGGEVRSIDSSVPQYSATEIAERVRAAGSDPSVGGGEASAGDDDAGMVAERLRQSAAVKRTVADTMSTQIAGAGRLVAEALAGGHKVLLCGNGGSAADAQHIAAEIVGRFEAERAGLPAIALTTDTSILTAVGNDYGFDEVFARQVAALGEAGDVLVAISTSGNSPNVVRAVETAKENGIKTIGLLGKGGGSLAGLVDAPLIVPAASVARIQESHITIGHIMCELVDRAMNSSEKPEG